MIVDADVSQEDRSEVDRQLKTLEAAKDEKRVTKPFYSASLMLRGRLGKSC